MRLFLFLLFSLFSFKSFAQNRDSTNTGFNFDIYGGFSKNLSLKIDNSETENVHLRSALSPGLGIGISMNFRDNICFFMNVEGQISTFLVSFDYADSNNELGYNVTDKVKITRFYGYFDLMIGKSVKFKNSKQLTFGGGINVAYQDKEDTGCSFEGTSSINNTSINIFNLEFYPNGLKILLSPKIFVEYEILKFKKRPNSVLLNLSYNYSRNLLGEGNFMLYAGAQNYSHGIFSLSNHYLSLLLKLRIGEI